MIKCAIFFVGVNTVKNVESNSIYFQFVLKKW